MYPSAAKLTILGLVLPPAVSALVLLLFGKRLPKRLAASVGTSAVGISAVAASYSLLRLVFTPVEERTTTVFVAPWISVGRFEAPFEFVVDPLSVSMAFVVSCVAFLIHGYSIGYMDGDPRFSRFFAYMNLFVAFMLVLVTANNLVVMFLGWEGVGLCSFLLISFWFERKAAATAGKKAFITNRIGDVGFALGTAALFAQVGTVRILGGGDSLAAKAPALAGTALLTAACLLLFAGAVGKSAQFPLLVWLPDAMEGPTPVSALIHAATMVTAGVYMIARLSFLFGMSALASNVVAVVGAGTAFLAATAALGQYDLKKVLAYSTVSQLGFMFTAVGVGAFAAAIFHLFTHAFFKALLFLGAGSVMHAMHDTIDIRRFGGLRKHMPLTAATFMVGYLAIAGIAPFSGFFSKDAVLASVFSHGPLGQGLWVVLALTSLLTAIYMGRATFATFYGDPRFSSDEYHPHESPPSMGIPLVVLAAASAVAGLVEVPQVLPALSRFLEPSVGAGHETFGVTEAVLMAASLAVALCGIWVSHRLWVSRAAADRGEILEAIPGGAEIRSFFERGWDLDRLYQTALVRPGQAVADFLARDVDRSIIDGLVEAIGAFWGAGGRLVSRLQTGHARRYALAFVAGTLMLLVVMALSKAGLAEILGGR